MESIAREYWCVDMMKKIKKLYESCDICERNKNIINKNDDKHIIANEPFEILEMDHIIVDIESKGYRYILVVTDVFSRKTWFLPAKTLSASETYLLLFNHVFSPFNFPKFLYSDLGSSFENELDSLICKATGMSHRYTLPRSKGHTASVENRNKVVEMIISKFVSKYDQSDWSDFCFSASYAYNKSINPLTDYSPDYLIFGTNPFSIVDLDSISVAKEDYAKSFLDSLKKAWSAAQGVVSKVLSKEKEVKLNKNSFVLNQFVWLSRKSFPNSYASHLFSKFEKTNLGPFKLIEIDEGLNRVVLQITPSRTFQTKVNFISPFNGSYVPDSDSFSPYLDEVIPSKIPSKFDSKERVLPDKNKLKYNVKSIVGKRVNILWSNKKFYKATVIGYTNNLAFNLVYFDDRTVDKVTNQPVDPSEDYYKLKLFKTDEKSVVEKWSLLS